MKRLIALNALKGLITMYILVGVQPIFAATSSKNLCRKFFSTKINPKDRFFKSLKELEKGMNRARNHDSMVDYILDYELRNIVFSLESLGRVYQGSPNKKESKLFKKFKIEVKALEDAIGGVSLAKSLLKKATKLGVESSFLNLLENNLENKKAEFNLFLEKSNCINPKEKTKSLKKYLKKINWLSKKDDTEFITSTISKKITELKIKIEKQLTPLITQAEFDYHALEEGLHELRRDLRWIVLYMQSTKDIFTLSKIPKNLDKPTQDFIDEYLNNKYAQLPPTTPGRIKIDRIAYYEMARFIGLLGDVKDAGETIYYLSAELGKHLNDIQKANSIILNLTKGTELDVHVEEQTQSIFIDFKDADPLTQLLKDLEL